MQSSSSLPLDGLLLQKYTEVGWSRIESAFIILALYWVAKVCSILVNEQPGWSDDISSFEHSVESLSRNWIWRHRGAENVR